MKKHITAAALDTILSAGTTQAFAAVLSRTDGATGKMRELPLDKST